MTSHNHSPVIGQTDLFNCWLNHLSDITKAWAGTLLLIFLMSFSCCVSFTHKHGRCHVSLDEVKC